MATPRALLFYDADCGLCTFLRNWVHRIDRRGRVRSIPIGSREADPYLGDLGEDARFASMHVLTIPGQRTSAGIALLGLLEALPLGEGVAHLLRATEFGRRGSERLYGFLARFRSAMAG